MADKKTHWGKEIVVAVIFAVLILFVLSFYCKNTCIGILLIGELVEKCEERGMELDSYTIYPNENSVKIGCKNSDYMGFEDIILNATG